MADRQLRLTDQVVRTLGGPRLASLGDAVVIDLSEAQSEESAQITYYFAGLAAGLGIAYKVVGKSTLAIG